MTSRMGPMGRLYEVDMRLARPRASPAASCFRSRSSAGTSPGRGASCGSGQIARTGTRGARRCVLRRRSDDRDSRRDARLGVAPGSCGRNPRDAAEVEATASTRSLKPRPRRADGCGIRSAVASAKVRPRAPRRTHTQRVGRARRAFRRERASARRRDHASRRLLTLAISSKAAVADRHRPAADGDSRRARRIKRLARRLGFNSPSTFLSVFHQTTAAVRKCYDRITSANGLKANGPAMSRTPLNESGHTRQRFPSPTGQPNPAETAEHFRHFRAELTVFGFLDHLVYRSFAIGAPAPLAGRFTPISETGGIDTRRPGRIRRDRCRAGTPRNAICVFLC